MNDQIPGWKPPELWIAESLAVTPNEINLTPITDAVLAAVKASGPPTAAQIFTLGETARMLERDLTQLRIERDQNAHADLEMKNALKIVIVAFQANPYDMGNAIQIARAALFTQTGDNDDANASVSAA
ncbi:MAG: hypothetical protein HRJ53_04655 [Acidobacteria bacterium Pan2503]|uniref:Uncharacterized protein n=1 Tax=Candidatus Acidiferrum panamense TaxID=2741543 RepID=A0A7V8NMX3_9BACT|nr:hypothetical protein [Candidatus Acidoferrum panamensis]